MKPSLHQEEQQLLSYKIQRMDEKLNVFEFLKDNELSVGIIFEFVGIRKLEEKRASNTTTPPGRAYQLLDRRPDLFISCSSNLSSSNGTIYGMVGGTYGDVGGYGAPAGLAQMPPLFDLTITNINLATHGRLEAMNDVLISSIAASTFNTQLEAWEALLEPFDGIFKFETYHSNEHIQPRIVNKVRVVATSIFNINISVANLKTFAEPTE